jgi:antitoxin (DNA-binding transcriptional repressor) of toxin-antitoxin stability system
MTLVTLAEACLRLPELIALVAKGEQVVIVENNVVLAQIAPPPFQFPTPEDEAERRRLAQQFERDIARWHEEDGLPYPPTDLPREQQPESPAA